MDYEENVRAGPEEKNLVLTVHHSNQCGNAKNCLYPYSGTSDDPEELKMLFSYDHNLVCHHCGKKFESYGNKNRKYCCRACYVASRQPE